MKASTILQIISALIISLFVYTAVSKLLAYEQFKTQLYDQALPVWLSEFLIATLPAAELFVAGLLLIPKTRSAGFYASAMLMALFTAYVSLVLIGFFGRVPCSCGGVLQALSWKGHLILNILYLLLSVTAIYMSYRERRSGGTD